MPWLCLVIITSVIYGILFKIFQVLYENNNDSKMPYFDLIFKI